jgi:hypothetical protein
MRMIKSLLLGSAAGLAAMTGAQAADLPVKAKPVEYVKICTLYGAGFYYIPGTDTCIKIGGHLRSEVSFNSRGTGLQSWNVGDGNATMTRDRDLFYTRQRVFLATDTRTQTAYGTLRTFSNIRFEYATPVGVAAPASVLGVDQGIIQWGGFTIGKPGVSYLDTPYGYATMWSPNGHFGVSDTSAARFVLAYTHQFGNGISGTIALEDGKDGKRPIFNGTNIAGAPNMTVLPGVAFANDSRGGNTWPDVVGQLRIDQAWGGFHIGAAVTNVHTSYSCAGQAGCHELFPTVSDKVGGAVNVGFKFNVPTGVNDAIYLAGSWGHGMTSATFGNANTSGNSFAPYGSSSFTYASIAFAPMLDAVYNTAPIAAANNPTGVAIAPSGLQLTNTYGGFLAFEHGWNAEWRSSIYGGAQFIDYNGTANAILCSNYRVAAAPGVLSNFNTTCNMDYRVAGVGTRTFWTPVRDLTIGADFLWTNHHSGNKGALYATTGVNNFKAPAIYEVKDQNIFSGMFSVRRFF